MMKDNESTRYVQYTLYKYIYKISLDILSIWNSSDRPWIIRFD